MIAHIYVLGMKQALFQVLYHLTLKTIIKKVLLVFLFYRTKLKHKMIK